MFVLVNKCQLIYPQNKIFLKNVICFDFTANFLFKTDRDLVLLML